MDELRTKLLIVAEGDHFLNLVSIGDIQRAIIRGIDLQAPIQTILREKSKIRIARQGQPFEQIRQIMIQYKTEFMPVIDDQENIVEVIFWQDVFKDELLPNQPVLDLPVVIMAGGQGTRLRPLTNIIPKALIPVGDKPIIELIIERFYRTGSRKYYISVNHKHEMIRHYLAGLNLPSVSVEFIQEDYPLGTAGSLYLLRDQINSTFIVSNCDILLDQDFRDVLQYHRENHNDLTIISALKNYNIPYGTLHTSENGLLTTLQEKPDLTFQVNTGVYVIEPSVLKQIPENQHLHITQLIEQLMQQKKRVGVFPVSEKSWMDIGQWKDYRQTIDSLES